MPEGPEFCRAGGIIGHSSTATFWVDL